MSDETTALVVQDSPLPAFSGAQMAHAFRAYQELQAALDKAMPDQIMQIRGRPFRKKGYWRSVRTAFNLAVEMMTETRRVEGDDWGWLVTYRAIAPNGRTADGDGACFASEKRGQRGDIQPTEHNVRSHAHTRAFNRAVSNLVGFGEVSAEEMPADEHEPPHPATAAAPPAPAAPAKTAGGAVITEKQLSRFWAILYGRAKTLGLEKKAMNERVHAWLKANIGIEHAEQIPMAEYDRVIAVVEEWGDEKVPF